MQAIIGISPQQIAAATAVPEFKLGTGGAYDHPTLGHQEFIYGRANGAVTGQGFVCVEQSNFRFAMLATANSGNGSRVGAAQAPMLDQQYGWFQVYGKGSLRTLASALLNARLNTTATGGAVDDDGTATSKSILGVVLLTSTGGAPATNPDAVFNYPQVGITL